MEILFLELVASGYEVFEIEFPLQYPYDDVSLYKFQRSFMLEVSGLPREDILQRFNLDHLLK